MSPPGGSDDFDPTAQEEREIGREMVDQSTGLGSVMAHFYRGEVDRTTTWRGRLDQTTNWAVTVLAAILTYGFSGRNVSHAVLLVGMATTVVFLGIESRRYQGYDVWRSRVRMLEENLFANALDPSSGIEHRDWRAELSHDLRHPAIKTPYAEAVGRRLRRVYLPLLVVLLFSWLFRVSLYVSGQSVVAAASLGRVPGYAVLGGVGVLYLILFGLAFYPRDRQAMGEFADREYGEWKRDEDEEEEEE